jgi:hypothetical protein
MDFDQPPSFTEEPDRERPRAEQDCLAHDQKKCTVCQKPALSGYSTCGGSYCQQIETLRNQLNNSCSQTKSKRLAGEIKALEAELFSPR